ncbi:MAG: damage-inducible protein DinB [Crocinitomicaceae bacterium]|nr:damage-inducible protein DinB [Crocinitomicaceae bacterium]|tara:strand:+ start:7151 stop:7594 length:444 start_codon:yes stop_codon:yes gene_type:complete
MKDFFKDIYTYQHHYNQQLADLMSNNKTQVSNQSITWFSHIINAHRFWISRIEGTAAIDLHKINTIDENKSIDTANYNKTQELITQRDISQIITYKNSKGIQYTNSLQEILFHVSNHHTHHRGQIIADLRKNGVTDPFASDYIVYKR